MTNDFKPKKYFILVAIFLAAFLLTFVTFIIIKKNNREVEVLLEPVATPAEVVYIPAAAVSPTATPMATNTLTETPTPSPVVVTQISPEPTSEPTPINVVTPEITPTPQPSPTGFVNEQEKMDRYLSVTSDRAPKQILEKFYITGTELNIDPLLLFAIASEASGLNPNFFKDNRIGIMGVKLLSPEDKDLLINPDINIRAACLVLRSLNATTSTKTALESYFESPEAAKKTLSRFRALQLKAATLKK